MGDNHGLAAFDRDFTGILINPRTSTIYERKSTSNPNMNKNISQVWTFLSDSNLGVNYETLQSVDGTTSCNCKDWTRRVDANGNRSCKHTRYVDMGIADQNCTATHNYNNRQPQPQRKEQIQHANKANNSKNHICPIPKLGHRKITV